MSRGPRNLRVGSRVPGCEQWGQQQVKMEKLILSTAILLCGVSTSYARDAALEAADVMFYDKNCAKLPADFVNAKIKEATNGATAEATGDKLKEAQDLVQASFNDSQLSMKKYCGYERPGVKCELYG